jgi:hypothetical protein
MNFFTQGIDWGNIVAGAALYFGMYSWRRELLLRARVEKLEKAKDR